jgi:hypothetical protein
MRKMIFPLILIVLFSLCAEQQREYVLYEHNISMVVTPGGEFYDLENWKNAFHLAREYGVSISNIYLEWGEMELSQEKYDWEGPDFYNSLAETYDMDLSVELKVIGTNRLGAFPQDVVFTEFSDTMFVERFCTFVVAFLERYPRVTYLWIGNEIDIYLKDHPDHIEDYYSFFCDVYTCVKSQYPHITVGAVSTYHSAVNNNALHIIDKIPCGDIIGLSVYMQDDRRPFTPGDTVNYFDEIMQFVGERKVAVLETSWSTRGYGGTEEDQKKYVEEVFTILKKYNFEFFGWFILHDFPSDINREVASEFGLENQEEFVVWQGSLGLLESDGKEKKGWIEWMNQIDRLREDT